MRPLGNAICREERPPVVLSRSEGPLRVKHARYQHGEVLRCGSGRQGDAPRRFLRPAWLAFLIVLLVTVVVSHGVTAQDVYSEKTLEISRKLQCPVCAGQSVADSGSQLAGQMRAIIEQKVQAGESEAQIIDFFVARYGESIVTEPSKSGFTLALWWMPVVVVALGALVVGLFVRERTRQRPQVKRTASPGDSDTRDDEELEAIARDVLGPQAGERMSGA